jgi:hypothetical protein
MRTKLHYLTCDNCGDPSDMYEFSTDVRIDTRRLGWTRIPRARESEENGKKSEDRCPKCSTATGGQ